MPYTIQEIRKKLDPFIDDLLEELEESDPDGIQIEGVLNYSISRIVTGGIRQGRPIRYYMINRITGIYNSAKEEFYRRIGAPYETDAMNKNGDIKEYIGKPKEKKAVPAIFANGYINKLNQTCRDNPCQCVDIGDGYSIKYDTIRQSNRWTAIGPDGRIVDTNSVDSALSTVLLDIKKKSNENEMSPLS